jgi:hypothetical protein
MGDTTRESNFSEVSVLKKENEHLKQLVSENFSQDSSS